MVEPRHSLNKAEALAKRLAAQKLFLAKRYADALRLYDEVNVAVPNNRDILFGRALCLSKVGQIEQARMVCDHLTEVLGDPRGAELKKELKDEIFQAWDVDPAEIVMPNIAFRLVRAIKDADSLSASSISVPVPIHRGPLYYLTGWFIVIAIFRLFLGSPIRLATTIILLAIAAVTAHQLGVLPWPLKNSAANEAGTSGAIPVRIAYTIEFPGNTPSGILLARPVGQASASWVRLGYAQGSVGIPEASEIAFSGAGYTGAQQGVAALAEAKDVKNISLASTGITDTDLAALKAFSALETINLADTGIGDAGLAILAEIPTLRQIDLGRVLPGAPPLSAAGLAALQKLEHLESLRLAGRTLPAEAASLLATFKNLAEVDLGYTALPASTLVALKDLANLRVLGLGGWDFWKGGSPEALQAIAAIPHLREMDLTHTRISDELMGILENLSDLSSLNLTNASISSDALTRFKTVRSGCSLSQEGLREFRALRFPANRNFGMIAYGQQEARGTVYVPPDKPVVLTIASDAANDLKPLDAFDPACFAELTIQGAQVPSEELAHIGRLTGLTKIRLEDCALSGRYGLAFLAMLSSVAELTLSGVRVEGNGLSGDQLAHLGQLRALQTLVIANTEIADGQGLTTMKEAASITHIRFTGVKFGRDGLKGINAFKNLKQLELEDSQFPDETLGHLTDMPGLEILSIKGSSAGDYGVACLGALAGLRTLNLAGTQVTDQAMAYVGKQTTLEHLDITGLPISDAGLTYLTALTNLKEIRGARPSEAILPAIGKLKALESLDLTGVSLSDNSFIPLVDLKNLGELRLGKTPITGTGLARIAELSSIYRLYLEETPNFDAANLALLKQFPKLASLNLKGMRLNDSALAALSPLTTLRGWLNLSDNPITDDGLAHLAPLTGLRYLYLGRTQVTGSGIASLASMKQLRVLYLDGTPITDQAISALSQFHALEQLDIQRTSISQQGADQLRKALPRTQVLW